MEHRRLQLASKFKYSSRAVQHGVPLFIPYQTRITTDLITCSRNFILTRARPVSPATVPWKFRVAFEKRFLVGPDAKGSSVYVYFSRKKKKKKREKKAEKVRAIPS